MSELLRRVKAATRAQHQALEDALGILAPEFNLAAYTALLARFYGYYQPIEARLDSHPHPAAQSFCRAPRRSAQLAADLADLGLDAAARQRLPLWPLRADWPPPTAHLWGLVYVWEGAALGGQLIAGHLGRRWGWQSAAGRRFFIGVGPATGARWRAFAASLEAQFLEPHQQHELIEGARAAFGALHAWCTDGRQLR